MRDFDPASRRSGVARLRGMLPSQALDWVDRVISDQRYHEVKGARNPLTHARLPRVLDNGRTQFLVAETGTTLATHDMVSLSRDLATEHVTTFVDVVEQI